MRFHIYGSFELLAPVVKITGLVTIILATCLGVVSGAFFLQFLILGYAFATVISIGSDLQEEITYKRYNDWQDVMRPLGYCFLEHFSYRQMHMLWRLQGMWEYLRGRPRVETSEAQGTSIRTRALAKSPKSWPNYNDSLIEHHTQKQFATVHNRTIIECRHLLANGFPKWLRVLRRISLAAECFLSIADIRGPNDPIGDGLLPRGPSDTVGTD